MKRVVFLVLFLFFLTTFGFAQADLQPAAIVNVVRSEPITVKQLRTEVERMEKSSGRTLTDKERRDVLDVMINERLAIQAAEKEKITVSENEVTQQINQLKNQMVQSIGRQPTDAEFAAAVKNQTGLDPTAFRDQVRRQLTTQKYLMTKKESLIKSVEAPTDAEIRAEFELRRTQFIIPETVFFSMIQVPYGSDAASRTKARELADQLAREIGSNANKFEEVLSRGQTPNAGFQSMKKIPLPRNVQVQSQVGQDFMNTAFNLNLNEVSKVIEGVGAYQIIKVTSKTAMENLELTSIIPDYALPDVPSGTRVTVRDYISVGLSQGRQMKVLTKASEELVQELRAGKTFQVFEKNLNW